jgi:hypothetical protein
MTMLYGLPLELVQKRMDTKVLKTVNCFSSSYRYSTHCSQVVLISKLDSAHGSRKPDVEKNRSDSIDVV